MEKNNSKMWMWIAVVIVVILAIVFFVSKNNQQVAIAPVVTDTATSTTTATSTEPASIQDTTGIKTGVGSVSISYENALIKYADRRIQLDLICQAHPNVVTYKDNTGIMIDNRSPQTRTVKVGTTFTIKPWGFKIVTLPDVYLKSKTLLVDCDKSQNVATILVQE